MTTTASSLAVLPGGRILTWADTDWDDPRGAALRESMDVELSPRYAALRQGSPRPAPPSAEDVAVVVLALVDGKPAATGALRRLPDRWEVKRLVVDADHRRLGLASRILARLEDAARDRGAEEGCAHTGTGRPAAIARSGREGWERIDVFAPYDPADGISVCFRKALHGRR